MHGDQWTCRLIRPKQQSYESGYGFGNATAATFTLGSAFSTHYSIGRAKYLEC